MEVFSEITPLNDAGKCSKKMAFSSAERELLISLVSNHPIIENKQSNTRNIELKRMAWEDIENAYNSVPYVFKRTAVQLKRCWENMKSSRKKELSIEAAYSSAEKKYLISLVSDRPIIENKQSNTRNIELKRMAWEDIENAYNSVPNVLKRTAAELQRCWEIVKSRRKKELSTEAGSLIKTGGGVGEPSTTENVVDSICPYINLTVPGVIDSNMEDNTLVDLTFTETKGPEDLGAANQKDIGVIECPLSPNNTSLSKKRKGECLSFTPRTDNNNKLSSEVQVRMKRCKENIAQDLELHKWRVEREKLLIKKEEIIIEREAKQTTFQEEIHNLEVRKLKLEIALLEQKLTK